MTKRRAFSHVLPRRARSRRVAALLVAPLVAAAALVATTPVATSADATELLPDLYPWEPLGLVLAPPFDDNGTRRFKLGFASQSNNLGVGALMIRGSRPSVDVPTMTAEQVVMRSDGTTATYPSVGTMQYVVSADNGHMHWHLLKFMVYELRRASDYSLVSPDQKTGFCLGDHADLKGFTGPNKPPAPVYTDGCGWQHPEILSVEEGLSVGYGDPYKALLEGQSVDITGLPEGYYYLIMRVNADGALHETDLTNNASSLQLHLVWPNGQAEQPAVETVQVCPGKDHCLDDLKLGVSSPRTVRIKQKAVSLRVTLSRAATVRVSLLGRTGASLVSVRSPLEAGTSALKLQLPAKARHPGRYTLRVIASGPGLAAVDKRIPIRAA